MVQLTKSMGFVVLVLMMGCPKSETRSVGSSEEQAYLSKIRNKELPNGTTVEEIDLNEDGKPDVLNHYQGSGITRVLLRKDVDLNFDGQVDISSWFDEFGNLDMEEADLDYDGKVDTWNYYQTDETGKPERIQAAVDTDFDGKPNIWTNYRAGKPVRKERDTNGDGRIDVWEKFDEEGNVIKAGKDSGPEYDGVVDERYDG